MTTHSLSESNLEDLVAAVNVFAQRFSFAEPIVVPMPTAVLRLAADATPAPPYAIQLVREDDATLELDRIEIRADLRRWRLGSHLFYAFERWARRAGVPAIIANAHGAGAPLAAQVGFDFAELDEYRAHLAERQVDLPAFRFPFEVLRMQLPVADGYSLLKATGFSATRLFDADPVLERQADADRESLGW